jgi:hypothetical protein
MSGSEALLGVPMHIRDSSQREASDNVASVNRSADFERLVLPLLPSLYDHASWLTRHHAEAEDLVQETFSKALRSNWLGASDICLGRGAIRIKTPGISSHK